MIKTVYDVTSAGKPDAPAIGDGRAKAQFAAERGQQAEQRGEQRALATAVPAEHEPAFSRIEAKVDLGQQRPLAPNLQTLREQQELAWTHLLSDFPAAAGALWVFAAWAFAAWALPASKAAASVRTL